jgi:hypothetical protein
MLEDYLVPCLGHLVCVQAVLLELVLLVLVVLGTVCLWYYCCFGFLNFQILLDLKDNATG